MVKRIFNYIANQLPYCCPDSWIEVSSQPSSSSLSSVAEDVASEGLRAQRVQHEPRLHARRRIRPGALVLQGSSRVEYVAETSSQDEYEESESESDKAMSSSYEGHPQSSLRYELRPATVKRYSSTSSENLSPPEAEAEAEQDEEGVEDAEHASDTATAIGIRGPGSCFTPQPNAFSNPDAATPMMQMQRTSTSYRQSSRYAIRPLPHRHSYPSQAQQSQMRNPNNATQSTHHTDHDAALRASLSTLLSCAAAARGLPKARNSAPHRPGVPSHVTPGSLRLVPESVALGTAGTTSSSSTSPDQQESKNMNAQSSLHSRSNSPSAQKLKESTKRKSTTNITTGQPLPRIPSSKDKDKDKDRERESRSSKRPRRIVSAYDPSCSAESLLSSIYSPSSSTASSIASIEHSLNPTLITWVLSAGVVVLVSALSFSAGFVAGRDSGHAELISTTSGSAAARASGSAWGSLTGAFDNVGEPAAGAASAAAGCGRDVAWGRAFGLKRLRWAGSTSVSV